MFTFGVGGVAQGADNTGSACPVGILALVLSGISIVLSAQAVVKFPKGRGPGQTLAYFLLTGSLFVIAMFSFAGDSGYVLRNCK